MSTEREHQDVQADPISAAVLLLQDNVRRVTEVLDGEVAHLRRNGWTDSQARAIVATTLGWRAPDDQDGAAGGEG